MYLKPSNPRRRGLCSYILVLALLSAAPGFASELDDANQDWAAGNVNSAVVRLKSVLQDDPNDAAARLLLGQIYLSNGEAAAAEQELERARRHGAVDAEVLPSLVEALVAQRKQSRVMELTEVGDETPATLRAELLGLRGPALLGADDPDAARVAFQQANEADPRATRPLLGLASLALAEGNPDRARELVRKTIEIAPEQDDGWSALGALDYQANNFEAAAEAYGKALEYAKSTWLLHYQRGLALLGTNRPASAEADAFVAAAPDSAMAITAKAAMLSQQGDRDAARVTFARALEIEPGFERAALALAALELADEEVDVARQVLDDLLTQDPGNTNAVFVRAAIERRESGEAAFIAQIRAGLEASPSNLQLRTTLVQQLLAQKAADQALELLAQAPATQADEPALIMLRAQAELAAGHPDLASSTLARLADLNPQSAQVRFMQAAASIASDDTRAMQQHLTEGLELDRDNSLQPERLAAMVGRLANASERDQLMGASLLIAVPEHPAVIDVNARYAVQRREFDQAIDAPQSAAPGLPKATGLHARPGGGTERGRSQAPGHGSSE